MARLPFVSLPNGALMCWLESSMGSSLCRIDTCSVNVRFDDGAIQEFSAVEPADHSTTTLFINNETRFVSQLRKSKVVRVESTFYQEGSRTLEFNVEDFKWQ